MATDPIGRFLDSLGGMSFDKAIDAIKGFVAHPTSNLTALLVSVTIVLLILVAITLLLVYLLMPRQRTLVRTRTYAEGPPEPGAEPIEQDAVAEEAGGRTAKRGALAFWGSGVGVAVVLLLGALIAYGATSTDRYCLELCHATSKTVVAAQKIDHADCVECHESRGVVGVIGNAVSRTRMAVVALSGQKMKDVLPVDSSECLRCHAEILEKTIEVGGELRVDHVHIVEGGDPCTSCHENPGHTNAGYSQGMSRCIVCHDGVKASGACDLCHIKPANAIAAEPGTPASQVSTGDFVYQPVDASVPYCDGCHDVANECDPCHGVRMPHDDTFISGGHAREAAFEGKQRCWKCHTPEYDCGTPCHGGFKRSGITGHPPSWKTEHQITSGPTTCGCHDWSSGHGGSLCPLCH